MVMASGDCDGQAGRGRRDCSPGERTQPHAPEGILILGTDCQHRAGHNVMVVFNMDPYSFSTWKYMGEAGSTRPQVRRELTSGEIMHRRTPAHMFDPDFDPRSTLPPK